MTSVSSVTSGVTRNTILYILCGLPGSGKSTWARKMVEDGKALCVSRDAIRTMIGGGKYIYDTKCEVTVKQLAHRGISTLLNINNVIVDETHLTKDKRFQVLLSAKINKVKPVIVYFTETDKCIDHRMNDPRGYTREKWEKVINGMKESFEEPTEEECEVLIVA